MCSRQTAKAQQQTTSGSYINTARLATDAKGVGKILLGVGLVGTVAFGDAPGGALGVGLILSATLGGTTTAVSGVADIAGNHTNTDVREANEVLEHTSTVSGLVFSATGHPKAAGVAGTLESAATLGFRPKDAMKNPATMIDAGRTVQGLIDLGRKAWGAVSSAFSSGSIDTLP